VPLPERGIIDSIGTLEVIFFTKDTFGIAVENSEMLPDSLDFIERIENFAACKKRLSPTSSIVDSSKHLLRDYP